MLGANQNRRALEAEGTQPVRTRESREDLLERVHAVAEELRQERGISADEANEKTAEYLSKQLGVKSVWNAEDRSIDWAKVKDGQLVLLANSLTDALRKLRDTGNPL